MAILFIGHEAESGVRLIANQESTSVVSTWTKFDAQQQCLRDAITRLVPRGSRVHLGQNQSAFLAGQLAEISIPWARPVTNGVAATDTLAIVPGSECEGESLSVGAAR